MGSSPSGYCGMSSTMCVCPQMSHTSETPNAAAISHARRRVSLDSLHEPAQCQLMELLARSGDKAGALRQYRTLVDLLQRELGAEPAPETANLAQLIEAGSLAPLAPVDAQPITSTAAENKIALNGKPFAPAPRPRRHNLPAQTTSFVGREGELAELARWLAECGMTQSELAREMGVSLTTVHMVASGKRRAGLAFRYRLMALLGSVEAVLVAIRDMWVSAVSS